jgi:hypothetical protein
VSATRTLDHSDQENRCFDSIAHVASWFRLAHERGAIDLISAEAMHVARLVPRSERAPVSESLLNEVEHIIHGCGLEPRLCRRRRPHMYDDTGRDPLDADILARPRALGRRPRSAIHGAGR